MGSWLEGVQSGTVGSTARHEHKAGVVEEQEREFRHSVSFAFFLLLFSLGYLAAAHPEGGSFTSSQLWENNLTDAPRCAALMS